MRRLLLASIVVAAVAPLLAAQGGIYVPPVSDFFPVWSPDATAIVYWRGFSAAGADDGPHVVNPDGTHDRRLAGLPAAQSFAFDATWKQIAFADNAKLEVMKPDGTARRVVATEVSEQTPAFSPDGSSLAYVSPDGVHVVGADGTGARRLTTEPPAFNPGFVWSPDGSRLAYTGLTAGGRSEVVVANVATGAGAAVYADGASGPSWSPDGAQLAFFRDGPNGAAAVVVVGPAGTRTTTIQPIHNDRPLWTSDGASLVFSSGKALRRLDLASGKSVAIGPPSTSVALFGDREVAYSAAGVCADRIGIYVAPIAPPSVPRRITNDCHVYGTPGPDRLTSSDVVFEIVDGRGGDDVLVGRAAPYVGDSLVGGSGNDILRGDSAGEKLDGGTGNDRIDGGAGPDTIIGGPGADSLHGQGGRDTIYARDGQRDIVDCGTNASAFTRKELDTAYVDRRDVVRHCERVFRR
jgi:dipeptidyl aminopeptidase/acylaminoacyl peptidase